MDQDVYYQIHLYTSSESESDGDCKDEFDDLFYKYQPKPIDQETLLRNLVTVQAAESSSQAVEEEFGVQGNLILCNLLESLGLDLQVSTFKELHHQIHWIELMILRTNRVALYDTLKQLRVEIGIFESNTWLCIKKSPKDLRDVDFTYLGNLLKSVEDITGLRVDITRNNSKMNVLLKIKNLERELWSRSLTLSRNSRLTIYSHLFNIKNMLGVAEMDLIDNDDELSAKEEEFLDNLSEINQNILCSNYSISELDFRRICEHIRLMYLYVIDNNLSQRTLMLILKFAKYMQTLMKEKYSSVPELDWNFLDNHRNGGKYSFLCEGLENINKDLIRDCYIINEDVKTAIIGDLEILYDATLSIPEIQEKYYVNNKLLEIYTKIKGTDKFSPIIITPTLETKQQVSDQRNELTSKSYSTAVKNQATNTMTKPPVIKTLDKKMKIDYKTAIRKFKTEANKIQKGAHLKSRLRTLTLEYYNWLSLDVETKNVIQVLLEELKFIIGRMDIDINVFTNDYEEFKKKLNQIRGIIKGKDGRIFFKIMNLIYKNGRYNFIQQLLSEYQLPYFMYFFLSENEKNVINQQLEELNIILDLKVQIRKGNYEVFVDDMTTMKSKLQNLGNSGYSKKFNAIESVLETNPKPKRKKTVQKKVQPTTTTITTTIPANIYPNFKQLTKGQKHNIQSMLKTIHKTLSVDIDPNSDYATFVQKMTMMKEKVRNMPKSQQRYNFLNRIGNIENSLNVKPKEDAVKVTPISAKEMPSLNVYPNFKHLTQGQKESLQNLTKKINTSTGVFVDFYVDFTTFVNQMKKMKEKVRNMPKSDQRNTFLNTIVHIENYLNVKQKEDVKMTPISAKEVLFLDVYPNFKHLTQGQKENLQNMLKKINTSTGVFVDFYVNVTTFVSQMKQMKEKVGNMKKSEEKNNFLQRIEYVEKHLTVKPANPLEDVYPKFKLLTVEQKEWFQNVLDSVNIITSVDANLNSEYSTFVRKMKAIKDKVCEMENSEKKSNALDKIQFVEQYLVDKKPDKTRLRLTPTVPDNSEGEKCYLKFNNLSVGQKQCLQNMLKKVIELTGVDVDLNSDYTNFSCKLRTLEEIVREIPQDSKRNDLLKKIEYVQKFLSFDPEELYPKLTNLTKEQREHLQNVLNEVNVVTATNIDINNNKKTFVHQISLAKNTLGKLNNSDSLLNKVHYVEDYLNDKLTALDNIETSLSHLTPENTTSKKVVYPKFETLTIGQKLFLQNLLKKVNVVTGLNVDPYSNYYTFINQMSKLKNRVQYIENLDEKKGLLERIEQVEDYLNEKPGISDYPNFKNLTINQKETTTKLLKHIKEMTGVDVNLSSDYTTFVSQMKSMIDTVSKMKHSLLKENALDIIRDLEAILNQNSEIQEYPNFKYLTLEQKESLQKMLKTVIDVVGVDVDVKCDYATFVGNMNKLKEKLRQIKILNETSGLWNRIECVENVLTIPSKTSSNENMGLTNLSNCNQLQAIDVMEKLETSPSISSSNFDEELNLPLTDLDVKLFDFSTYMSEDSYQKYKSLTDIEKNIMNRLLKDLPLNNIDVTTDDYFSFTNKMEALKNNINQMSKSKKKHMCLENIFKIETALFKKNQGRETNEPKMSIIKNIDNIYPQYNLLNFNQRTHISAMLSKINSTCNIKLDPMLDTASEFYNKLERVKQDLSTRKKALKKDLSERILYIEALLCYNNAVVPSYVDIESTAKQSPTTLNNGTQKIKLINIDCPEGGDKIVKKEYSEYRNLDQKQKLRINDILANINYMFNMNINAEMDDSYVFYQKLQRVKTLLQNNTEKERRIIQMQINVIEEFVGTPSVVIPSSNGLTNLSKNIDQKHLDENTEIPEKMVTSAIKLKKIEKKDSHIALTPNTMKSDIESLVKTKSNKSVMEPILGVVKTSPKKQYVRKYDSLTAGDKIHINNLLKKLNLRTKIYADVSVDNLNSFTLKLGTIKSKILGIEKYRLRKSYLNHVYLIEEFLGIDLTEIELIKNTMVPFKSFCNYSIPNQWYGSKYNYYPIVPNNSSKSVHTNQCLLTSKQKKDINQQLQGLRAKTQIKIDVAVDDRETFIDKLNTMKTIIKKLKKRREKYLKIIYNIEKLINDSFQLNRIYIDFNEDEEEDFHSEHNNYLLDLEYFYTVYKICGVREKRKINSLIRNFNNNTQGCLELYLDGRPLVKLSRTHPYGQTCSLKTKQRNFINKFNYQQEQINEKTNNDLCGESDTAQEFIKKLEYSMAIINKIYTSKKSKMPWKLIVNELKKNIVQYKRYLESCNVQTLVTPDITAIYKEISTLDEVEINEVNKLLVNLNETCGLDLRMFVENMTDFQYEISQLKQKILQMNEKGIQLDCAKAVYTIEQLLGCKKFEGPFYEFLISENIQPMGRTEHLHQIQEELNRLQNAVEWSENIDTEIVIKTVNCPNYTCLNDKSKTKFNNILKNINKLTGNNLNIESDINEFVGKLINTKRIVQSFPKFNREEILANITKIEKYLKFKDAYYPNYKSLSPNQIKYINRKLLDINTLINLNIHVNMDYHVFVNNMQEAKSRVWLSKTMSKNVKLKCINRLKEVEVQLGRNEILTFSSNKNGNHMEFAIRIKNLNFALGQNSNLSVEMPSQLFLKTCEVIRNIINDQFSNKEYLFNKLHSLIKLEKYADVNSLGTFEMITWGKFHHLTKMLLRNNDVSVNEWLWRGFNIFENIILEKIEEFQDFLIREDCDNADMEMIVEIREQYAVLRDVLQCIVDFRALKKL